jgi:DNA-binding MarR family transcriptional regulator
MPHDTIHQVAQDLLAILPQLNQIMATEVRREVGEAASVSQLRLMSELEHGPQTLSTLARHRHVSPQALCNLAHDLVERGWLERIPHPTDRRQQLLTITDAGYKAFATARMRALDQIAPLLATLNERELAAVEAALPALQRVLSAHER